MQNCMTECHWMLVGTDLGLLWEALDNRGRRHHAHAWRAGAHFSCGPLEADPSAACGDHEADPSAGQRWQSERKQRVTPF